MQAKPLIRDIAIVIYSRGREDFLARLIADLDRAYIPALEAGKLSATAFIYAQNYTPDYLAALRARHAGAIAAGRLILFEAERAHSRIGDVFVGAAEALHARLDYRLAMLMDDDSLYRAEPEVDANLRQAAREFLEADDRAYSIKLGQGRALEYWPFMDAKGPIMPFKEKMLWLSRAVMEEALAFPALRELSVGEDAVLSALAWKGGAERCFGVFGIASFLHLAFEPDEEIVAAPVTGGYGELVGYVEGRDHDPELGKYGAAFRSGVVPFHVLPEIFVGPEHPHHTISGVRPEAVARYGPADADFRRLKRDR
jgi:hypothetical protein